MNGADAASRGGFRNSKNASELLQRLTEAYQRRHYTRLNEALKAAPGSIPPRVKAHLEAKVKRLEGDALVTVKFQDAPANTRGSVGVGHAKRPFLLGKLKEATCSCSAKDVDQEPCACLVKAATASGFDLAELLHERDSVQTWKQQYMGLPDFKLPSTEEIETCQSDKFLVAASSYPVPRGRPSTKRRQGAIDMWGNKKKKPRPLLV